MEKDSLPYVEEILTETDKYNEYIITRLRTKWGVNNEEVPEYLLPHFKEKIKWGIDNGYVIRNGQTYLLTRKGKHFADRVSMELMYE